MASMNINYVSQDPLDKLVTDISRSIQNSYLGRLYTEKCPTALKNVCEVISAIVNFIFNKVLGGLLFRIPNAIFYDLPYLLRDARAGVEVMKECKPTLDILNKVVQDPENATVLKNVRSVAGAMAGPASHNTRANFALVLGQLAKFFVEDDLRTLRGVQRTVADVDQRLKAAKDKSLLGLLTSASPKAATDEPVRRSSRAASVVEQSNAASAARTVTSPTTTVDEPARHPPSAASAAEQSAEEPAAVSHSINPENKVGLAKGIAQGMQRFGNSMASAIGLTDKRV